MPTIRQLPLLLINQIAAGEVIERPASVVKELVENSLDGGATRIRVAVENGGRDLVEIADDGVGIAMDELVLAVAPHATSKITEPSDLESIATMGFRGEALASIASISRMSILSRRADDAGAAIIEVEGDVQRGPRPEAGPPGTTVTVRNLFFNTPARRKFLRTDQTEAARIADVVDAIALANPSVAFELTVDGRTRRSLPSETSPRRRAVAVLGKELDDELLEIDAARGGVRVWGLLGKPDIARATGKSLRLFLNGRPFVDRAVIHAVREAYRGLIAPDRHPTAVIMLSIDPALVDVNVHPAKAEVRFRQPSLIHEVVRRSVGECLSQADLVPTVAFHAPRPPVAADPVIFGTGIGAPTSRGPTSGAAASGGPSSFTGAGGSGGSGFAAQGIARPAGGAGLSYEQMRAGVTAMPSEVPPVVHAEPPLAARAVAEVLQVHDKYVVAADEDGLVIIDQHALHERVMFEKLKSRIATGRLESQRMLVPTTVDVGEERVAALDDLGPLLDQLGIEAQQIGPRSIAIHAFTSLLFERKVDPGPFLRDLLETAEQHRDDPDSEAALHEVLDMMSCKAAIKAGDSLTAEELRELLAFRENVDRASRCPHGRPTTVRITLAQLDKQFGR